MNTQEFIPVRKPHNNSNFIGGGDIKPLPATRYEDGTINSVWMLPSFWQRLRFLFHGEITLRIYGCSQPPVAVVAGDIFE